MDQLLKKIHNKIRLIEEETGLSPEKKQKFQARLEKEKAEDQEYNAWKNTQPFASPEIKDKPDDMPKKDAYYTPDSDQTNEPTVNEPPTLTYSQAKSALVEIRSALVNAGIKIDFSAELAPSIVSGIQQYREKIGASSDQEALIKLLAMAPDDDREPTRQSPPIKPYTQKDDPRIAVNESVGHRKLSDVDRMTNLLATLTRLDESTLLTEADVPVPVPVMAWWRRMFPGAENLATAATKLGAVVPNIKNGLGKVEDFVHIGNGRYRGQITGVEVKATELERLAKATFGDAPAGASLVFDVAGTSTTFFKKSDGTWVKGTGAGARPATEHEIVALEKKWAQENPSGIPNTPNPTNPPKPNPSTTNPPKPPKPNTGPPIPPSVPKWGIPTWMKWLAAFSVFDIAFKNGILSSAADAAVDLGKKVFGSDDTDERDPDTVPDAPDTGAKNDTKNSEEINKLVKQIQELENNHGKDSDPAWSKAVEHANAVFARLGFPPFDNSIPKPKPVAPAPRPVASPAPVAAASAVPPESVVPQDMVQPVDLQQNYQQPPVNQQNSNTFIPFPIPLGGFGGGRGNGGGRGPQNGRGYPGAGGQIRGGVGTPGGGNRGGRR